MVMQRAPILTQHLRVLTGNDNLVSQLVQPQMLGSRSPLLLVKSFDGKTLEPIAGAGGVNTYLNDDRVLSSVRYKIEGPSWNAVASECHYECRDVSELARLKEENLPMSVKVVPPNLKGTPLGDWHKAWTRVDDLPFCRNYENQTISLSVPVDRWYVFGHGVDSHALTSVTDSLGVPIRDVGHLRFVLLLDVDRKMSGVGRPDEIRRDMAQIVDGITIIPQWEEGDDDLFVAEDLDMVDGSGTEGGIGNDGGRFLREGTTGLPDDEIGV